MKAAANNDFIFKDDDLDWDLDFIVIDCIINPLIVVVIFVVIIIVVVIFTMYVMLIDDEFFYYCYRFYLHQ